VRDTHCRDAAGNTLCLGLGSDYIRECVQPSAAEVGNSIEVIMLQRVEYITEYFDDDGL
jgi:hypothetical protein